MLTLPAAGTKGGHNFPISYFYPKLLQLKDVGTDFSIPDIPIIHYFVINRRSD